MGPKPMPGDTATWAFSRSSLANSSEPRVAETLGDGRPDEHGAAWLIHGPTGAAQAVDQDVAAFLIGRADLPGVLFAFAQGDDGGDLDGLEDAVIQIALDARQGADHARIAHAEAHAPSRHVVAFRHGEDLHGDILGAFHLQDAGRLIAVEAQVGVGEIVDDHGAVVARPGGPIRGRNRDRRKWWWDCAGTRSAAILGGRVEVR